MIARTLRRKRISFIARIISYMKNAGSYLSKALPTFPQPHFPKPIEMVTRKIPAFCRDFIFECL